MRLHSSLWYCLWGASLFGKSYATTLFCHYLVGGISLEDATNDVVDAKNIGIEAFALNLFNTQDYSREAVANLFNAADAQGFSLFFSFDMNNLDTNDPPSWLGLLNDYQNRQSYYKVNGRPFLSTFNGGKVTFGQSTPDAGWQQIFAVNYLNPFFVPDFDDAAGYPGIFFSSFPNLQGLFSWETAWPSPNQGPKDVSSELDTQLISQARAASKSYMMPWSSYQYKHLPGDYYYRIGELNFAQRIPQILSAKPDFVELISWNDGGEGHYIGNVWLSQVPRDSDIGEYEYGFDHTAWQQLVPAVAAALQSGNDDVSTLYPPQGKAIAGAVWYRSLLTTADCPSEPSGAGDARDVVNYAFLLPAGSARLYVKVFSGGQQIGPSFAASAGLNSNSVPGLTVGNVRVEVYDVYNTLIGHVDGSKSVTDQGSDLCNWNYVVGGF